MTEVDGLKLLRSENPTGYEASVCSMAAFMRKRAQNKTIHLGSFDTAVEAAVAYAKHVEEVQQAIRQEESERGGGGGGDRTPQVTEVDGLQLHLSSKSTTGYVGVTADHGRFKA